MSEERALALNEEPKNVLLMPSVPSVGEIESVMKLAEYAYRSGMVKTTNVHAAFFIGMYGRELGIPPITAMRTIYSVKGGTPTCSGEAMLSLLRRSGKVLVTLPNPGKVEESATVKIKRLDTGEEGEFTFTKKMAQQAGLMGNTNWQKYPAQMLIWRAVSMGAKMLCSDIIGGLYTVEEIRPDVQVDESGQPLNLDDVIEAEYSSVSKNHNNESDPTPEPEPSGWANKENVKKLWGYVNTQLGRQIDARQFLKAAGVEKMDAYTEWAIKYKTGKVAGDAIIEKINGGADKAVDVSDEFGLKELARMAWPSSATLDKALEKARELCGTPITWKDFSELAEIEDDDRDTPSPEWESYESAATAVEAVVDAMEEKLIGASSSKQETQATKQGGSLKDINERLEHDFGQNSDYFLKKLGKSLKDFANNTDKLYDAVRAYVIANNEPVVVRDIVYVTSGKQSYSLLKSAVGEIRMYGSSKKLEALDEEYGKDLERAKANQDESITLHAPLLVHWEDKSKYRATTSIERYEIPF